MVRGSYSHSETSTRLLNPNADPNKINTVSGFNSGFSGSKGWIIPTKGREELALQVKGTVDTPSKDENYKISGYIYKEQPDTKINKKYFYLNPNSSNFYYTPTTTVQMADALMVDKIFNQMVGYQDPVAHLVNYGIYPSDIIQLETDRDERLGYNTRSGYSND